MEDFKDKFAGFRDKPYRPGQEETIEALHTTHQKVTAVCAPTGSGKSLIGMVTAAHHLKSLYLCSTKQLQRQLTHDFPEALYMMGRANFPCNLTPSLTADLCLHTRQAPCKLKSVCKYEVHKRRVLAHPLQILNYHYALAEGNYVGGFTDYPLVICDEADQLEGILTGFVELKISRSRLDSLHLDPPRRKTSTARDGLDVWREWATDHAGPLISARVDELTDIIQAFKPGQHLTEYEVKLVKEHRVLTGLQAKLDMFTAHVDTSWIFQEIAQAGKTQAWSFQPVWLTPELSQQYFFRHGEQHVLMSATFPPKQVLAATLGINTGDLDYTEIPSSFPAANRPVILKPVADMSYKKFDASIPSLLKEIDRILHTHLHEKGIIHTVSWKLNQAVMSMRNPRLISHNGDNKDINLERFAKSTDGVFVSPSSTRGVDLPDDQCRFIIIAKAPFQSLGDKLVNSRVHGSGLGKFWYRAICAQDIVQASGRGVRHKDDYCETYILDRQAENLIVNNQALFPRYWIDAVDY